MIIKLRLVVFSLSESLDYLVFSRFASNFDGLIVTFSNSPILLPGNFSRLRCYFLPLRGDVSDFIAGICLFSASWSSLCYLSPFTKVTFSILGNVFFLLPYSVFESHLHSCPGDLLLYFTTNSSWLFRLRGNSAATFPASRRVFPLSIIFSGFLATFFPAAPTFSSMTDERMAMCPDRNERN